MVCFTPASIHYDCTPMIESVFNWRLDKKNWFLKSFSWNLQKAETWKYMTVYLIESVVFLPQWESYWWFNYGSKSTVLSPFILTVRSAGFLSQLGWLLATLLACSSSSEGRQGLCSCSSNPDYNQTHLRVMWTPERFGVLKLQHNFSTEPTTPG